MEKQTENRIAKNINKCNSHVWEKLSNGDINNLFCIGRVNRLSQVEKHFRTKCSKCGVFAHDVHATIKPFVEPKKSKNQVRRERHIFKRLQAKNLRVIAHNSKLVNQIIDGDNVAPNHMKTNSVATIKQNERSRFRVVNYDRQISKGKGCTCDGMNFMCKSHRRKFKMT
tara:strand:- start:660 stop:1166 length:507 start_codon:yes stop_codon:yes gene_type:complete